MKYIYSRWTFKEGNDIYSRSEGLALASLYMFLNGAFSTDPQIKLQVDGGGLQKLSVQDVSSGFQVYI